MLKFFVLFALFALALAGDKGKGSEDWAEVKTQDQDAGPHGGSYNLELSNGVRASQHTDEKGNAKGEFEWVDPKGEHVKVSYIANEHGYQPTGDWIPTPPPIPEAILKSLEWIANHPPQQDDRDDDYKH